MFSDLSVFVMTNLGLSLFSFVRNKTRLLRNANEQIMNANYFQHASLGAKFGHMFAKSLGLHFVVVEKGAISQIKSKLWMRYGYCDLYSAKGNLKYKYVYMWTGKGGNCQLLFTTVHYVKVEHKYACNELYRCASSALVQHLTTRSSLLLRA